MCRPLFGSGTGILAGATAAAAPPPVETTPSVCPQLRQKRESLGKSVPHLVVHRKGIEQRATKILPALKKIPVPILVKLSGLSPTTIKDTLAGRSRPYRENREVLAAIVRKLTLL